VARVEWTRQTGDDVEAVVGMLICSQFPNAVRVTPSQGDGGLDIFVAGPAGYANEREVYQVKKFCERLTNGQKRQITRSFNEVKKTSHEEGWTITKWHLVMPVDMTDNELNWLAQLTEDAEFTCETNGLLFCDTLAAHFPKVIDYYLRDGKDRLQEAMNGLASIIRGRQIREDDDALRPTDVVSDLASIYQAINSCDPFYHYDFAVSDRPPADQPDPNKPGLVAVSAIQQGAVWVTIDILATSLAALEESPVGMRFNIAIPEDDDELREQFQKFVDYGAPMTMPVGTVSGSLDLPGGLGGELRGASLQVLSTPDQGEDEEPAELSLAILAPDSDTVIASTTIRRTELSAGQAGVRSVFTEKAGLFTFEMFVKSGVLKQGQMNLQVQYDLAGRRPSEVVDGLQVLAAWRDPNRLAFGLTYGPPDYSVVATDPLKRDREAGRWAPIAKALMVLQEHVAKRLRMPPQMTKDQAMEIIAASKVVSGEPVTGTMSGSFEVSHQAPPQLDRVPDKVYEFQAIKKVKFELGDDVIEAGRSALFFLGRYVRIEDALSEIEPVSDGVSIRYTGEAEVTRIMARDFHGNVTALSPGTHDGDGSTAAIKS
jgi:hypothetical protein